MIEYSSSVPRVIGLTPATFISEFLQKHQPVVVSDAMQEWKALSNWTPEYFEARFGNEQVQVYGDLFRLMGISPLSDYLKKYFGRAPSQSSVPYVRWYSHLVDDERVPWADEVFDRLKDEWTRPYFFPDNSFALPYCGGLDKVDPTVDWFPARGLFISAGGARTRLHIDPWYSDALLCQVYGEKTFAMYDAGQAPYLTNTFQTVDIDTPDLQAFPQFSSAQPVFSDVLRPGEILLVPSGWFHHFRSASDSISLTWNFVHDCRLSEFLSYLAAGPPSSDIKQLTYAYFGSPGRRSVPRTDLGSMLAALRQKE